MDSPKLLVTGSNGFLGSEIARQAIESGWNIRLSSQEPNSFIPDVSYVQADITSPTQITKALDGITSVIHAAGLAHIHNVDERMVQRFHEINVQGTINVLRAAASAGVKSFVLISSVSVYGPSTHGMCSEQNECKPVGPYAVSKYHAEIEARRIAESSGINLTILRLATLYGAGDPGNISRLMCSIDRQRFIWIGDGSNRKSLLHRSDAARASLVAAKIQKRGIHIYNISGPIYSMREIVREISMALGRKVLPFHIPSNVAISLSKVLSSIPNDRIAGIHKTISKWLAEDIYSTSRIEQECNFKAEVSLKQGISEEVNWYRKIGASK